MKLANITNGEKFESLKGFEMQQCWTYCGCEVDASFVLLLEADVRWLLIQSDAKALQLMLY